MLEKLPTSVKDFFLNIAGISFYSLRFFKNLFKPPFEWNEVLTQIYRIGYKSLLLVSTTGFIIGMVMTLQTKPTMEQFGAVSWLPSMVSVSIFREIGPVLTALICAGKVGSGIGAELGSMKVTEQVDAITASGANAFNFLVVTRVIATTITVPILVFYANGIALVGSYFGINLEGNMSMVLFYQEALDAIKWSDIIPATIKSICFGYIIGIIACYRGIHTDRGTTGVGQAANSSVVISSLFIFIIDLIAVQITQLFI
ncbi:MAG: ABC transporter permease [Fulvivirga sp.]|nr:ABC transporter permease [Fulvivirga sp.]